MTVSLVGNRIVRQFGNGENLKTVVSEVIDGKTFTKVLNSAGKEIKSSVKKVTTEQVGDKFVKTKTRVTNSVTGPVKKVTSERVYGSNHELLGKRQVLESDFGDYFEKTAVTKEVIGGNSKRVVYDSGMKDYAEGGGSRLFYNRKGLPMPEGERCAALGWRDNTHPELNEMSLKEMAKWHYENNPGVPYCSNPQFGLAGLDNRDVLTDLPKLNNLDELL